jgi:hypothetical protein
LPPLNPDFLQFEATAVSVAGLKALMLFHDGFVEAA